MYVHIWCSRIELLTLFNFISYISNELYTFSPFTCSWIYTKIVNIKKAQRFFHTCHHNLDINVTLSCSLLVIALMDMPYKNTYFYTCVRVYKYRRKTYLNFLNIIQSEPLPDLWTYFTFYVKYMYLLVSVRGNSFRAFLWPYGNYGFLIGFGRSRLCTYEASGKFNYLRTHCSLHFFTYHAVTVSFKS